MRSSVARVLVTVALGAAARAVNAQPSPTEVTRIELIRLAEDARHAGDHDRALDLAARAGQIRMTPSLQLLIAQEEHRLGHTLDAYTHALGCERAAAVDSSLHNRDAVLATCRSLTEALQPVLGRVVVRVASSPPGLSLRVAAHELPPALVGLPLPVQPGLVQIEASAPGHAPWRRQVDVAVGGVEEVIIAMAPLPVAALPAAALPVASTPITRPRGGAGAGPWVLAGLGVAAFVTAGVFYGTAALARDARDVACSSVGCLPIAQDHDARYEDGLTGTNVALGVGAAFVLGGGLWWLFGRPSARDRSPRVWVTPAARQVGVTFGLRL